ncbi:MAG: aldo/keto reductase [Synechococcales bacterium]|nr:aldo/keto reductase [Synechococcales bacterium]
MEKRKLGRSELEVSRLCFGGNVFGWTVDEVTSFDLLDAFVAAGGNFIDTADFYSRWVPGNQGGESEAIIGKWLKLRGNRDQIIIATKVGNDMGTGSKGLSKKHILQAVEASLGRLNTDYIDLYQSHIDDQDTPVEETLEAYVELIRQGKVRVIGASNFSPARLTQSLTVSQKYGYPRYECLQPLYNLSDRADYEQNLESVCLAHNIGVISYFSLASGFLTGKYRSKEDLSNSSRADFVKEYLNERGFSLLEAIDKVARIHNATPAQVSLAWILARPSITAPIASATKVEHLDEMLKALEIQLDPDSFLILEAASAA